MLKKRRSENDLVNLYYSCILFKKYFQYNLWFGSFGEYDNIKYCNKYIQIYVYCWINIFLLQRFSLSLVIFLYKSFCFIKFVESGFFNYLNYHFLLSFYNNCFTFDLKGKQRIKVFVKFYFYIFLKSRLEKDILTLVTKVINDYFLYVLVKHLIKRLKDTEIYTVRSRLNNKALCQIITGGNKKKYYFIGLFYFNSLIKNGYYESDLINFSRFYVNYCYGFKNFNNNKTLKFHFKSTKISKLITEEVFIGFPRNTLYRFNKDIIYLVRSFENLNRFTIYQKKIGLYKKPRIFFDKSTYQKLSVFKKPFKNCKLVLVFKTFNNCFVKYKFKRKFFSKILVNCNFRFFSRNYKKKSNIQRKKLLYPIKDIKVFL